MKYVVFGAAGQLGRDICPRLDGEVFPVTHERADLADEDAVDDVLREQEPNVVINCAAYNLVDKAEAEPIHAFETNAWGPLALARSCADRGCLLVHFSTDYVFGHDAERKTPYFESDAPSPVSVYGFSKLMGEHLVARNCPEHLVVRTCGLYGVWGAGGKGTNFVETMLRLAGQGKPLRVVHDQRCTPSYTADVADAVMALLKEGERGLVHVTNGGSCTWYEFAVKIFEFAGVEADIAPITSAEYGAAARRPPYSVLDSNRDVGLRRWEEALAAYLAERKKR